MAEPLASAQFRMDLNMDGERAGLFHPANRPRIVPSASASSTTSMEESGAESESCFLNPYNFQQELPTSTSGSSSSSAVTGSDSAAAASIQQNETISSGLTAFQRATQARTEQEALVQYGTALENFQTVINLTSSAVSAGVFSGNNHANNHHMVAVLYRTLCLRAMGQTLSSTNISAALALWDQALESLEQVMTECHRYSQRIASDKMNASRPDPAGRCLDAIMVEMLALKASALMTPLSAAVAVPGAQSLAFSQLQQQQLDEAIDCTIQALRFLLDVRQFEQTRCLVNAPSVVYTCLDMSQHSQLLIEAVQQLIRQHQQQQLQRKMLRMDKDNHNYILSSDDNTMLDEEPVWMQRMEQALHVLQTRQYELSKPQKLAMASIQESLSHVYLHLNDLERGSQAMADACDWLLEEQESPPASWLDRMELFGSLLEQEASAEAAAVGDPNLVDVDAGAALDLAMACYEKALLLRNQSGLLLAAKSGSNAHHDVSVANALSHVARVMHLQGNDEGSMDLFRAAQDIYSRQSDVGILIPFVGTALDHGRWDQAVAILSQCVELAESEAESTIGQLPTAGKHEQRLDKTYIYYSLAQAYVGRGDYVPATMCLMEAIKHEGQVSEPEIVALLQRVEFLRREENKTQSPSSFDDGDEDDDDSCSYRQSNSTSKPTVMESDDYDDGVDDEGTAFYDSESVSAFQPVFDQRVLPSASENPSVNVILDLDLSQLESHTMLGHSDKRQVLDLSCSGSEVGTEKESMDDDSPPLPVVSPNSSCLERSFRPPTTPISAANASRVPKSASLDKGSTHSAPNLTRRLGSPIRSKNDQESVGESSQRSGFAKAIASTFRLAGMDWPKIPSGRIPKDKDKRLNETAVTSLPPEDEFHAAIDTAVFTGPTEFIGVPQTKSFDSDISSITVRVDDANSLKVNAQELWWGVSTEGLGRWLPTVVNTAVEVAEGFLSARSIHSQKKRTPLFDYASDDSDDENDDLADVVSRPAIADSRTQLAVRGSRASNSRAKRAPRTGGNYDSGALSLYSGHRRKIEEVDVEIARLETLVADHQHKFGRNHMYRATSLFTLAVLHSQHGASGTAAALECATEALRIQKECGTIDDASRSLHFLANLYLHQKQYSTSLTYYAEALRLERAHYGEFSDETAKTLNCIGTLHSIQHDFFRAMECHQEALRILQETHGEDIKHPLVSETLCHIGSVYYRERNAFTQSQSNVEKYTTFIQAGMLETIGRAHEDRGSYKTAIPFFEERLAFLESHEADMEDVCETVNSLGMLSSRAGRYSEALDYYEKSLRMQLKLGCDAVQLATIRILVGSVHFQLGDWQRALRLHQDALAVLQDELGHGHETVAAAYYQIGLVQASFYHLDDAMESLNKAADIQERLLGADHPAALRTRREIGNLFSVKLSECDTALEHFDEILNVQRALHGDRHPNIAETLFSIGRAYARRGDYSSALQILEETYHMRTETLGHDVPAQATTLYEISLIHRARKHYKRALQICDVVLTIREDSLRDKHIDIALTKSVKGSCFVAQNRLDDADKLLSEALTMGIDTVGELHPSVAEIHLAISSLHLKRCHFEQARASVERALLIYERFSLDDNDFAQYKETTQQLEKIDHDESLFV